MSGEARAFEFRGDEFAQLCRVLYERTGLSFDESRTEYLRKRVALRVREVGGADGFPRYLRLLRDQGDRAEFQTLVNLVTVNETYFFREQYQLECAVRSLLPELVAQRPSRRKLRLWSMPCSTGEEPYSLAIFLLERWAEVDRFEVEIFGSDIDTEVLREAQRGVFSARSVRNLPESYLRRYFSRVHDGWRLSNELLGSVTLTQANLADPRDTSAYRDMDVIFCRNLLIYFDDVSRRAAAENLYASLAPGGFLCLGHSESMSRISSLFELRKFPEAIVYQRPVARRT